VPFQSLSGFVWICDERAQCLDDLDDDVLVSGGHDDYLLSFVRGFRLKLGMRFLSVFLFPALTASTVAAEQANYWPLSEGDRSTFLVVRIQFDGRRPMKNNEQLVLKQEEFEGKRYFRVRTTNGSPSIHVDKLVRKDTTGVYFIDPEEKDAGEQTELLLSLKIGQSWTNVVKKEIRTQTVIGIESVSAAGTEYKDCYHIQSVSKDAKRTEDYWLAPNLGIVKGEVQVDNQITERRSLKSFKRENPYSWTPPTPRPVPRRGN